ncbi:hypothetical protein [Gordonia soli]|uniref:Uncharacterized protein n=1 Tax=Gordonia soli NBRC 108243 TaxID=1223545 RepID=M0QQM4_9ACTN|nr:hypothetical protein [Gordonia soli]GAC70699.1 hypothetical protein GS4_39_00300 [Gordonia soli NBRC 108243]
MSAAPDPHHHDDASEDDAAHRPRCGRDRNCWCPADRGANDLDTLLASPGFAGTVLDAGVDGVAPHLPLLDQVVGVTVAGPVIMNDVGAHHAPVGLGGPIRCDASRITLRLNPARLGAALVTDPAAHVPPTLRLFDADGNTAHATYLTEDSDRLAFEAIAMMGSGGEAVAPAGALDDVLAAEAERRRDADHPTAPPVAEAATPDGIDQIEQFDSILGDGGAYRLSMLPAGADVGMARVPSRRVIAALEHAALLGMPMTLATSAPGCVQMRHDHLDGAREHRGSMVLASGTCRTMINFNLVTECWITWAQGAWGRTGSIEVYDRHGRCSLVATQTGSVSPETFSAWEHLMTDLAGH